MAGTYNITGQRRGDTYPGVSFTYVKDSTAIDLTGASIRILFRGNHKTGSVTKTLTNGSGITIDNATGGIFSIDAFIIDLPVGNNYYDVQVTLSDGTIKTYVEGYMEVLQDVSYG